jgi:pre-mRNA-splicing factor ATP-dependent RNA helicase DHX15/PRP43
MQINKYTGRPFSAKFWSILEKRRTLPVWDYYNKFMETVKSHSVMVLVGETGSGKTTQVTVA